MHKPLLYFPLFLFVSFIYAQDNSGFCEQLHALDSLIRAEHYKPKPVNDSLSKHTFNLFIKSLDNDKRFFTESDINSFKADKFKIDDYIKNNTCDFISKYSETLELRIKQSIINVENLKNQSLDYSGTSKLTFGPKEGFPFFKNDVAAKKYWSRKIRYLIITEIIEEDSILSSAKSNFKTLEIDKKNKIIDNQVCILQELLNQNGGLNNFVQEKFLNAFIQYQDPNSVYFNNIDKTVFENALALSKETFGIITRKSKNGEIIISHIIPGSSAFKNDAFEVDDTIKSLTSGSNSLDTYCIKNKDVVSFLNDENNKTVTFKIKKKSGSIINVQLNKTVLKVEKNAITGYLVGAEKQLGYIKIPSFYTNIDSYNGRGLTADFAKELYILQRENIEGLIIDLRYNGGGSMQEAIDLSGMFIDRGPISIIRDKSDNRFTFKDPSRGTFFSNPIVILINNYSASASEFFASTMQDYNRALLVGSKTYGKSSAQVILPLHKTKSLGFSKITTEVFYRVTGKSLQSLGVTPDIELPSIYDNFKIKEADEDFPLNNDTIQAKLKHKPLSKIDLSYVQEQSKQRLNSSPDFLLITDVNKQLLDNFYTTSSYTLTLDNVFKDQQEYKTMWQSVFNNKTVKAYVEIHNSSSTNEFLSYNDDEKSNNSSFIENLSKDIYIHEAYNILNDLLNTNH